MHINTHTSLELELNRCNSNVRHKKYHRQPHIVPTRGHSRHNLTQHSQCATPRRQFLESPITYAMQEPVTAPWNLSISNADFQKLTAGFEPFDQDDKWRVSVRLQSQGNIAIHVSRSATGIEHYVLFLRPSGDSNGGDAEAITWEQNVAGIHMTEEQAKKEVVMVLRSILECDFEALPEYDFVDDIFNYPGYKIGAKLLPDGTWTVIPEQYSENGDS